MSTPKISFKVPSVEDTSDKPAEDEVTGDDVTSHDVATAPGKEREREPIFGGEIANISQNPDDMDVDTNGGG